MIYTSPSNKDNKLRNDKDQFYNISKRHHNFFEEKKKKHLFKFITYLCLT